MIYKITAYSDEVVDQIMTIWTESTTAAHPFIPAEYWHNHYELVRNRYLPEAETYAFCKAGKIEGFISVLSSGYIGALFVAQDAQGQGIGSELIEYVKATFGELSLAVYAKNNRAVKFYMGAGFYITEEQINKETGELEYIMSYHRLTDKQ